MSLSKIKLLPIVLIMLLVFLQYRLWFSAGGVIDMMRLKKQVSAEFQINDKLKKRNQVLTLQIEHLQKNQEAIESRARRELGMIKKGETFYQVVEQE